ncbi:MAG: TetM/TetW/TetO/TetS family tetracycline resistance ribosomal protection protein, partial [Clostridia bacterium]|nr:TetM/TetW/TetO/TetS family tetracycline resistance ribosomal protection protein [Clostridia bacterium]
MKKAAIGILAHVDSGKTTLSEAMLYKCGEIRTLGRVDHKDAFLDTDLMEKERGITIFSKQAVMELEGMKVTLLDTPGHVDFSAETERALWVMDYAILVISGLDGVQSHTQTLWKLLKRHGIPVFVFVNKMDISNFTKEELMAQLQEKLSSGCVDFENDNMAEEVALCDENLMEQFLETENIEKEDISSAIYERKVFPCFFGSALKLDGVEKLLDALSSFMVTYENDTAFGAKVFKISEDEKGVRLTHMKITGGSLCVRDKIEYGDAEEKVSEIRIYSGAKYKSVPEATIGDVCAVCGLTKTYAGMGLGMEENAPTPVLESVFTYKVTVTDGTDMRVALAKLKKLEEEENRLHVIYNSVLGEIHIRLMGEVQLEIMQRVLRERFSLNVEFEQGSIVYKETIAELSEGVGHYEPLRHYAEVHLVLEPLKRGSGIVVEADCSEDELSRNWQRLILTHIKEKNHIGVLTGSPITDMKITLKAGKAHLKHTDGGDFRQAT